MLGAYQKMLILVVVLGSLVSIILLQIQNEPKVEESRVEQIEQRLDSGGLEVREAVGQPQPVNNLLQGSPSTQQTDTTQVEQPSSGLLEYLQPNSGQSTFSE